MKPLRVMPSSSEQLMAGQTVYIRLVSDQDEIRKAHKGKDRTAAYQALRATEAAWEAYNTEPTVDHWNNLQIIGSNLDAALRKLRGERTGTPGTLPPCRTGQESWCKQPHALSSASAR